MPIPFLRGALLHAGGVGADLRPAGRAGALRTARRQQHDRRRRRSSTPSCSFIFGLIMPRRRQLRARGRVSSAAISRASGSIRSSRSAWTISSARSSAWSRRLLAIRRIALIKIGPILLGRDVIARGPARAADHLAYRSMIRLIAALADAAEADAIAREHDAVGLRTVEPARLVAGPFEGADALRRISSRPGTSPRRPAARGRARPSPLPARCARGSARRRSWIARLCLLERLLLPRRRQRRPRRDEVAPFQRRRILAAP